jgi:hypothetical protein
MKGSKQCPKCNSLRVGLLQGVVETNIILEPGSDAGLSHPGKEIHRDAYICGACGYYETYVRTEDMSVLDDYPDFKWLDGEGGPYL